IRLGSSQLNDGGGNWPDLTCDPMKNAPRTAQQWFDTSCFATPAQFQFGNYKYAKARGATVFNTDMSLSKRTAIGKSSLEVRLDVFNVFNRAQFDNLGADGLGVANIG